jgi:hypothetical protein
MGGASHAGGVPATGGALTTGGATATGGTATSVATSANGGQGGTDSCPGLYLGARQEEPRPDPYWTNPAIRPIASQSDTQDVAGVIDALDPSFSQTIKVTVKNQEPFDIQGILDLYWSDPSTGCGPDPTRLIETQYPLVSSRDVLGNTDSADAHPTTDARTAIHYIDLVSGGYHSN